MFYKSVSDGMIVAVSRCAIGEAISENEYLAILDKLNNIPVAPSGYAYCLSDSLEWELTAISKNENDNIGSDEALMIILGGTNDSN